MMWFWFFAFSIVGGILRDFVGRSVIGERSL